MENKKVMQNNFTGMKIGCKKLQILQKLMRNNYKWMRKWLSKDANSPQSDTNDYKKI